MSTRMPILSALSIVFISAIGNATEICDKYQQLKSPFTGQIKGHMVREYTIIPTNADTAQLLESLQSGVTVCASGTNVESEERSGTVYRFFAYSAKEKSN